LSFLSIEVHPQGTFLSSMFAISRISRIVGHEELLAPILSTLCATTGTDLSLYRSKKVVVQGLQKSANILQDGMLGLGNERTVLSKENVHSMWLWWPPEGARAKEWCQHLTLWFLYVQKFGVYFETLVSLSALLRGCTLQGQTKFSVAALKMSKSSSMAMGLEVCFSAPMILPRWLGQC